MGWRPLRGGWRPSVAIIIRLEVFETILQPNFDETNGFVSHRVAR